MTSLSNTPAYRMKQFLDSKGWLSGFSIDETGQTLSAPISQDSYPNETASNVTTSSAIISIQQLGGNGPQQYHQDINFRLHLWTPNNGTSVFAAYRARFNEIITALQKTDWQSDDISIQVGEFTESGETDSGRITYIAPIRAFIDYP